MKKRWIYVFALAGAGTGIYLFEHVSQTESVIPLTSGHRLSPTSAAFFSSASLAQSASAKVPSQFSSKRSPVLSPSSSLHPILPGSIKQAITTGGVGGAWPKASFQVDNQNYRLQPDRFGAYPRIAVAAGQKLPLSIQYPQGDAGDVVTAQTEDGGALKDGKSIVQQSRLDSSLSAQFSFVAGAQQGIYRVAVNYRGQIETLQFWVGPLPQMRGFAQGK